jgi:hypothetical protein
MTSSLSPIAEAWKSKGKRLEIPNQPNTYIWSVGSGPTVVCLHGGEFQYLKLLTRKRRNFFALCIVSSPSIKIDRINIASNSHTKKSLLVDFCIEKLSTP